MLSQYEKAADEKQYILFYKHITKKLSQTRIMPHFHNSVEFVFMLKGTCDLRINSVTRTLKRGDVGFINSFDIHKYENPSPDSEYYVVLISSDYFDGENKLSNLYFPSFPEESEGFNQIKDFLDYCYGIWNDSSTLFRSGFVNMLLSLMLKFYQTKEKEHDKQNETIISALRYIHENFHKDLTVESVAAEFGYSANYFSTVFNKFTGITFREYVNRCKITEFIRLKKESPKLPICKAAELCGFQSLNTFYRAYNKYKS